MGDWITRAEAQIQRETAFAEGVVFGMIVGVLVTAAAWWAAA